ncbi:MAG: hypothetical protein ABSF65_05835 [Candidatus Bathyarchaeia archaeon]|jgi:hypothetical protein
MLANDLFTSQALSIVNPFYKLWGESDNVLNKSFTSIGIPKFLELDSLCINGKIQCLFKPISVKIERVDNLWSIENERLRVTAVSPDYDAGLKDFTEQVLLLYEEYKDCADDNLTKDGLRFKHEIMEYFGGNQPK